ncbi:scavenger receptor class B member 1-like [Trichogramma pretiosum]|uniref:scavenger receptor class B member 1-like n=1 Tax=Trichogramma pretiosum TaxID=7493 RepID=UPI0006C9501B|nr:scavenger receptor class B member 1-like [Trichogramma pretiosum]XP_014227334.1 scavenger receptor class B member 1-like [Trichogramma pretiosum]XP_023315079.1 scavenger receptor class B member 1-like [Trichogramma pretiosum]
MKSLIELQQYRKCIVLFMTGVLCCATAIIVYIVDPVKLIVQNSMTMKPGSMIFDVWKKPPIEVLLNVYIFNITNPDAFLAGEENLKINEVGPYVYQEILENQNVTWNENGTLSYYPRRTVLFRGDLSVGDPHGQNITVPNIPMLGISSAIRNAGFFVNYPFVQLANLLNSQPILHLSVHDYLWGYDDNLVNLAGSVVPGYINFRKFGLLDRMYDEGDNLINMNIKNRKDMINEVGRYLSIEMINGSPGLSNWGYVKREGNETESDRNTKCNRLQGATEGTVFPANMDPKAVFRVFRKAFCRPVPITFQKKVVAAGLPAYQYTIVDNFADPPEENPDNECYCRNNDCLKKGLMDLTPCYYNIPAAASLPHFLNADPTLANGIEGLSPDAEKHSTVIQLQPNIGIPMYVHSRLQTNLIMKETRYNSKIKPFNNLVVPLFWTDLQIPKLPADLMLLLRLALVIGPISQLVLVIILALAGAVCVCWALARTVMIVHEHQQEEARRDKERRDSADLRIPLGYGQYTAIRILPAIKKITSKTDLFM